MSNTYAPLERWSCQKCERAGELSVPPATYGADIQELAAKAHAIASPECEEEWDSAFVRVKQGEYPD
jgi:hypothetical protein